MSFSNLAETDLVKFCNVSKKLPVLLRDFFLLIIAIILKGWQMQLRRPSSLNLLARVIMLTSKLKQSNGAPTSIMVFHSNCQTHQLIRSHPYSTHLERHGRSDRTSKIVEGQTYGILCKLGDRKLAHKLKVALELTWLTLFRDLCLQLFTGTRTNLKIPVKLI